MRRIALTLLGGLTLFACGDGTGPNGGNGRTVTSVVVTPSSATLVSLGETLQLTASASDASGNSISGKTFTWSSSDEGTATVNSSGLVTAVANASVTITATTDGVKGTAAVTVDAFTFAKVSAGDLHTCGVATSGDAYCWGLNAFGQLGDGTTTQRLTPTPVSGGLPFQSVSAGSHSNNTYSCGLTTGGDAYCWGDNVAGQLGDGTSTQRLTPTPVAGGLTFESVSAGLLHTCGVTTTGDAYCWGSRQNGALGDGTGMDRLTPALVFGGLTFRSVSAGSGGPLHTCGVTTSDARYCWGSNLAGMLGDGTQTGRSTPTLVSGGLTFRSVSAGFPHTCGVTTSDAAYCWGRNSSGQLGDGTTTQRSTPTPVSGGLPFRSVTAGVSFTCGVTTSGDAYCWGAGGVLGDGTQTQRLTPTPVSGGLTFQSVSSGSGHNCGVTTNGVAYCWGKNREGELGDGTTTDSTVPVRVSDPT